MPVHDLHLPERREVAIAWSLIFFVGIASALLLTLGGVQWLVEQLGDNADFKTHLITIILGLGFILVGPVLLFALAIVAPQWWFRAIKARARKLLGG